MKKIILASIAIVILAIPSAFATEKVKGSTIKIIDGSNNKLSFTNDGRNSVESPLVIRVCIDKLEFIMSKWGNSGHKLVQVLDKNGKPKQCD